MTNSIPRHFGDWTARQLADLKYMVLCTEMQYSEYRLESTDACWLMKLSFKRNAAARLYFDAWGEVAAWALLPGEVKVTPEMIHHMQRNEAEQCRTFGFP
jgi:hypothetical protein